MNGVRRDVGRVQHVGNAAVACLSLGGVLLVAVVADLSIVVVVVLDLVCCLLYTSPSPRDRQKSRMPSSA